MRLILFDLAGEHRRNFYPLSLSRPIWELRCGMTSLGEKLRAKIGVADVAEFVPAYLADTYAARADCPVNDRSTLAGSDLLLVNARVKADTLNVSATGPREVCLTAEGECLYARVTAQDVAQLNTDSIEAFVAAAVEKLPRAANTVDVWNYTWDLVLANADQITADFQAVGRKGIEGSVEQPTAMRGSQNDIYLGRGTLVHPMVVIDAENGPVYLDEDVEVHPFTRIEGPCYVGKGSILLGAKCREGNSIGPVCRIGGEVEESIIHGYSNKYHDGFLGHAYVGEWVNLGALTTNSDLKNDYGEVDVILDGRKPLKTGSKKVGSLIGDHTKTSIGTLLNTGSYVGAMSLILAGGKPLTKYIPDFSWLIDGVVTKGFGKGKLYETAAVAMERRKRHWSEAEQAMWEAIYELTVPQRDPIIHRGKRQLLRGK